MVTIEKMVSRSGVAIEYCRRGEWIVARTPTGVCYVGLTEEDFRSRFPDAQITYNEFEPSFERLHMSGTDFQIEVWRALTAIPAGTTTTYTAVARAISRPRAVRAVASAIGANPVAFIVPCHRVVRSDGGMGGFYWGLDVKRKLLASEGVAGY